MAHRAVPGGSVRCPWCDHTLPPSALECPSCRFPLAHPIDPPTPLSGDPSGLEGPGRRSDAGSVLGDFVVSDLGPPVEPAASQRPGPSTQSSAPADPGPPSPPRTVRPGDDLRPFDQASPHRKGRLAHIAVALGFVALMILVSGLVTLHTLTSPAARHDRAAETSLLVALARAQDQPANPAATLEILPGDEPSTAAGQVSEVEQDGQWFGAARSATGRCFVVSGLITSRGRGPLGTLSKGEPCTGAEAQSRLAHQLDPT